MFKFIRRISTSVLPRPDRPWRDDATSNAPTIGRKRRYSATEREDDEESVSRSKKARGDSMAVDENSLNGEASTPGSREEDAEEKDNVKDKDGEDLNAVTRGVKKVELEDKSQGDNSKLKPEGVPLPESPGATPPPDSQPLDETSEEAEEVKVKDSENADAHSVASGSGEEDAAESTRDDATLPQDIPSEIVEDTTNAGEAAAAVDSPSKPDAPDTQDTPETEE
ncbi:hypothetical protein SERLA73DRAFT_134315 [Serpula lacrymans var. lacrymans S7.3]|uniref:Uncharacterized protein n=2 Tax=Serpula lacrymans var. lacrymans TaxID=341189 RepID=F8PTW0_SERL3|nr:uncharacterized protein SERLADRAFT_385824 [Serpula lacrymans var. lacrymans S7.9]EGO01105.1 hypothetical protein SERLA73DRAFT_134315 [Serpula lacrymans var. lacrymans S7.3]EGO26762.1 hypothetical protein SERLADRAFT_385824 [Serpula lacrymans var. lacrymans S7.9]